MIDGGTAERDDVDRLRPRRIAEVVGREDRVGLGIVTEVFRDVDRRRREVDVRACGQRRGVQFVPVAGRVDDRFVRRIVDGTANHAAAAAVRNAAGRIGLVRRFNGRCGRKRREVENVDGRIEERKAIQKFIVRIRCAGAGRWIERDLNRRKGRADDRISTPERGIELRPVADFDDREPAGIRHERIGRTVRRRIDSQRVRGVGIR